MSQITCPNCGTAINLDESDYEGIVRQVRDEQFAREVEERAASLRREKDQALELARATAASELQQARASADAQLAEVRSAAERELAEARSTAERELAEARSTAARDLAEARSTAARDLAEARSTAEAQLARVQADAASELQQGIADRDAKVAELTARLEASEGARQLECEQAAAQAREESQATVADLQRELDTLKAQLENAQTNRELALQAARAEAEQQLQAVRANAERELQAAQAESSLKFQTMMDQGQREAEELRARLREQENKAQVSQMQAVASIERERDEARSELERERAVHELERSQARSELEHKLADAKAANEAIIRYKDEEIERLRDMKARLSTKMVGETLEQHCETEFNRLRMTAFPRAYFEKDNDASGGTKGDYIFRECDEAGNEIISIMFEMKNENDTTATKHKNEDFFRKLDHDRRAKGCEYAVLVSLLEPDSELYNAGIVDVSYRYEKMYVIRPQFFIPIITLLRNAAMNSLAYKQELALVRQQNVDVTGFEEKLAKFQEGFGKNYDLASRKFATAIDEIDKTIDHLQKVKENLLSSDRGLRLANDKAQELSIRKLTWGNKTMKAKFDEAREASERAAREGVSIEAADGAEADPADSYEV